MAEVTNSNLYNTGILNTEDACIVIVRTEWNASIVDELEKGVKKVLEAYKVKQV